MTKMKLQNLRDLYLEQLEDIYDAERQLVKALPKMAKAAESSRLKDAFTNHLKQTELHVSRLEEVFGYLNAKPRGKTCKAMKGLIEEGEDLMKEDAAPEVKDAGLITSAQRVEHYEMAAYGGLRTFAQQLGQLKAADILQRTLDEEGTADKLLTQIAL